jgi:CheY-like chemotaxis protein
MTAHAMAGDEDKSLEAGMNGHVAKPIDPDQLFSTLQKFIKPGEKRIQVEQSEAPVKQTEPDKAVPAEDELPESLAGFDLADGLSRLQGNKKLYRKLLLSFATDYSAVANEIRLGNCSAGDLANWVIILPRHHDLDQLFSLRPHPKTVRYRTPIVSHYLCGSGAHPSHGVSGNPGTTPPAGCSLTSNSAKIAHPSSENL